MKKRRVFSVVLSAALVAALVLPAQAVGEVVGHIYHTDIVAKIDGHPIPSYNIGGQTAVMVEDLKEYGFDVFWYADDRSLTVERVPGKEMTREYRPEERTKPAGAVAGDILATDIVAYVQGEPVESFNIQGHTALRLSALADCGDLSWDGESRIASLALDPEPMKTVLDSLIADLEEWKAEAGTYSEYTLYPNAYGTLFAGVYTGTTHGEAYRVVQVYPSGRKMDLGTKLGQQGITFREPREFQLVEEDQRLTFFAQMWKEQDGQTEAMGDTFCNVWLGDLSAARVIPVDQPLEQWDSSAISDHGHRDDEIEVLFTRTGVEVTEEIKQMFCGWTDCAAGSTGVCISFYGNNCGGPCEYCDAGKTSGTDTSWVFDAPSIADPDFVRTNSPELREKLARHFQVTWNGQPVAGDLWRSQGNGHVDYNFTFDQPIALSEGDVLRVWMK